MAGIDPRRAALSAALLLLPATLQAIPPPAPIGVTATRQVRPSVAVYWNEGGPPEEVGFKIERRAGLDGEWEQVAEVNRNPSDFSRNVWVDEDLPAGGAALYYRLRAFTSEVEGDHSPYSEAAQAVRAPTTDNFGFALGDAEGLGTYTYGNGTVCEDRIAGGSWWVYTGSDFLDPDYGDDEHPGEDWNGTCGGDTDLGQPVHAAATGRVVFAGYAPGSWGNIVVLAHRLLSGQTVYTQYAHLDEIDAAVTPGSVVAYRRQLGVVGKGADDRFSAHLHFEIRRGAEAAGAWLNDREQIAARYFDPSDRSTDTWDGPGFLEVIVDDADDRWEPDGEADGWSTQAVGYDGRTHWAANTASEPTAAASWRPDLSLRGAGLYQLYAFVPAERATATTARYTVNHNGGADAVVLDQATLSNEWASLGVFAFRADGTETVTLSNATGEAAGTTEVASDALRWRKRPGASRPLDLIFVIDTTGSMWDDLASVRTSVGEIVNRITALSPFYRVAVVEFKDFPTFPYGGPGDFPYRAVLPFSIDPGAIVAAVSGLSASGGADWPEAVYSALMRSIQTEGLGAWRPEATKAILLMGDAPPHDPEPFTGFRLADVTAAARDVGVVIGGLRQPESVALRLEEDEVGARIFSILIGSDPSAAFYFQALADGTGGQLFQAASADEVVAAILAALGEIPDENLPPSCETAAASESLLWPPNHRLVEVGVLGVTDPESEAISLTITGIAQNEPVRGPGSGNTAPDGEGVGTSTAAVRAERRGNGSGRAYEISFVAVDEQGAACSGSVFVCVPHDQGGNTSCPTEGIVYDSTED